MNRLHAAGVAAVLGCTALATPAAAHGMGPGSGFAGSNNAAH